MVNTNNTLTDEQAKLSGKPTDEATEQPAQATPTAKKRRQPKAKSEPVSSGSNQPAENNAKHDGNEGQSYAGDWVTRSIRRRGEAAF